MFWGLGLCGDHHGFLLDFIGVFDGFLVLYLKVCIYLNLYLFDVLHITAFHENFLNLLLLLCQLIPHLFFKLYLEILYFLLFMTKPFFKSNTFSFKLLNPELECSHILFKLLVLIVEDISIIF